MGHHSQLSPPSGPGDTHPHPPTHTSGGHEYDLLLIEDGVVRPWVVWGVGLKERNTTKHPAIPGLWHRLQCSSCSPRTTSAVSFQQGQVVKYGGVCVCVCVWSQHVQIRTDICCCWLTGRADKIHPIRTNVLGGLEFQPARAVVRHLLATLTAHHDAYLRLATESHRPMRLRSSSHPGM